MLVAHGEVFRSAKWPAFKRKYYGHCKIVLAQHLRFTVVSHMDRRSRNLIHACRLHLYFPVELETLEAPVVFEISGFTEMISAKGDLFYNTG